MAESETILLPLTRREAHQLYEHLMEQPYADKTDWQWSPIVKLADTLGVVLPAWCRAKAAQA